jgi:hypothetical protein
MGYYDSPETGFGVNLWSWSGLVTVTIMARPLSFAFDYVKIGTRYNHVVGPSAIWILGWPERLIGIEKPRGFLSGTRNFDSVLLAESVLASSAPSQSRVLPRRPTT